MVDAGSASTAQLVSQLLAGLSPDTTYHFRFEATNGGGTTLGDDATFTTAATPVTPPTITDEAAQEVTDTTATLSATVNANGSPTTYTIEYGTTTDYGNETPALDAGSGSAQLLSQAFTDLLPDATYHFRFTATNGGGTTLGDDATFTTAAAPVTPPTITDEASQDVTDTSATASASINPNGNATSYLIDYGTTTDYGHQTAVIDAGSGTTAQVVSQLLAELTPDTTYHFRFQATNTGGTTLGDDATFTTEAAAAASPPEVSDEAARNVTDTTVEVVASLAANGAATSYQIEYGTTTDYGQATDPVALQPNTPVSVQLSGLQPSTIYHFRVNATNSAGTTHGGDGSFTTGPQLTGSVDSEVSGTLATGAGCPASASIDWGDGSDAEAATPVCADAAFTVSGSHTYSQPGSYVIVVTVSDGSKFGATASIAGETAEPPAVGDEAAKNVTDTTATLSADVNPNGTATTYVVDYGTTTDYGQQTPAASVGGGSDPQAASQGLSGLKPQTTYHFRFQATNAGGTTLGPDATFTTAPPPAPEAPPEAPPAPPPPTPPAAPAGPPAPVQGVSVDVLPFLGTVLVNGVPLQAGQQIPLGATVDVTHGTVILLSIVNGVIQQMQFAGGVFQVFQLPDGTTQLTLVDEDFSVCAAFKPPTAKAKVKAKKPNAKVKPKPKKSKTTRKTTRQVAAKNQAPIVGELWGNGKGSFQTKGRYAAATVRGTIYHVADRCDGTLTEVQQGVVTVQDFVHNRTVTVNPGENYLAAKS